MVSLVAVFIYCSVKCSKLLLVCLYVYVHSADLLRHMLITGVNRPNLLCVLFQVLLQGFRLQPGPNRNVSTTFMKLLRPFGECLTHTLTHVHKHTHNTCGLLPQKIFPVFFFTVEVF